MVSNFIVEPSFEMTQWMSRIGRGRFWRGRTPTVPLLLGFPYLVPWLHYCFKVHTVLTCKLNCVAW
jgi:hypothetical protein